MKKDKPTVNDIRTNYYHHHCIITFINGLSRPGNFRHHFIKKGNEIIGWNFTFDGEEEIINVFHDQIASIERTD